MTLKRPGRTVQELFAHVQEIAAAFGVTIVADQTIKPEQSCAVPAMKAVIVAPITTEFHYAITMHELGHLIAPNGSIDGSLDMNMVQETAAWDWAEHYALDWTIEMEAAKVHGLESHRRGTEIQRARAQAQNAPVRMPSAPPRNVAVQTADSFASKIHW